MDYRTAAVTIAAWSRGTASTFHVGAHIGESPRMLGTDAADTDREDIVDSTIVPAPFNSDRRGIEL